MLLTIVNLQPLHAQVNRQGTLFIQPAELRAARFLRRLFPDYFGGKDAPHHTLITENLYPIGWSKDGKFAYYTEPGDEACGCYFAKLFITDLVNDKVLWSFDYNGLDDQDNPKYRGMRDLWRKNLKLFSDKLNQYRIIAHKPFSLLTFPTNHAGDQLSANLKIEEETDEEKRHYSIIKKATLQINSRRGGTKIIDEEAYPEYGPLAIKVLGYLKSPYEPRAAVIMIEVWRGYEGPPHVTHVKVAGSSLTTGFK